MDAKSYPKARRLAAVIGNSSLSVKTGYVHNPIRKTKISDFVKKSKITDYVKRCRCGRKIYDNGKKCAYCRRLVSVFIKPHMVAGHYRKVR